MQQVPKGNSKAEPAALADRARMLGARPERRGLVNLRGFGLGLTRRQTQVVMRGHPMATGKTARPGSSFAQGFRARKGKKRPPQSLRYSKKGRFTRPVSELSFSKEASEVGRGRGPYSIAQFAAGRSVPDRPS